MKVIQSKDLSEDQIRFVLKWLYEGNGKTQIDDCLKTKHHKIIVSNIPGFGQHTFDAIPKSGKVEMSCRPSNQPTSREKDFCVVFDPVEL